VAIAVAGGEEELTRQPPVRPALLGLANRGVTACPCITKNKTHANLKETKMQETPSQNTRVYFRLL